MYVQVQFEPVIRKFSEHLVTLELENEYLSNEENTPQLLDAMEKVFTQLNDNSIAEVQTGR